MPAQRFASYPECGSSCRSERLLDICHLDLAFSDVVAMLGAQLSRLTLGSCLPAGGDGSRGNPYRHALSSAAAEWEHFARSAGSPEAGGVSTTRASAHEITAPGIRSTKPGHDANAALSGDLGTDSPASGFGLAAGSFSPSKHTGSMPSSPFTADELSDHFPDSMEQPVFRPEQSGHGLSGKERGLNRPSGESLASRQSLGGPSESFTSWGSFHGMEEPNSSAAGVQQKRDGSRLSQGYAKGPTTAQGLQADHQEDEAPGSLSGNTELVGSSDPQAVATSGQEATSGDFIDTAGLGQDAEDHSTGEDPFREAYQHERPQQNECKQQVHASEAKRGKRSSLTHWEQQQLSGCAVSNVDRQQTEPMRTALNLQEAR